uniref:Sterol 24-C-methyltransferase n=1 Tax=Colletotrichum graminicola TaxID=31870 RepID=D5H444_COLGR|nr:CgERG6-1 protein [Colletotrichum graminicola]
MLLARDATFEKILHKDTTKTVGMSAMLKKDHEAQKAATDEYFSALGQQERTEGDEGRPRGSDSRLCFPHQAILQPRDRLLRIWLRPKFPLLSFSGRRVFQAGHRETRTLPGPCDRYQEGYEGVGRWVRCWRACSRDRQLHWCLCHWYHHQRVPGGAGDTICRQGEDGQAGPVCTGRLHDIPFEDDTFDAIYAIEATVHAPSLEAVYSEIFRVLKPGGVFGVYEWVMTDKYDDGDLHMRKIRIDIEQGDGIANMVKAAEALRAFGAAGFDMIRHEDMAERPDPSPWYWPLDAGSWRHAQTLGDLMYTFRMTGLGRLATRGFLSVMETLGVAPPGMTKMSDSLCIAADALVQGGKEKIFTPMYLMVGRKPAKKE